MCCICMLLIVVCKLLLQVDTVVSAVEVSRVAKPPTAVPVVDKVCDFNFCLNNIRRF